MTIIAPMVSRLREVGVWGFAFETGMALTTLLLCRVHVITFCWFDLVGDISKIAKHGRDRSARSRCPNMCNIRFCDFFFSFLPNTHRLIH